jgi:hypothetical protein
MMVMLSSPGIPKNRPIIFINGKLRRFYRYFSIGASYDVKENDFTVYRGSWQSTILELDDKKYMAKYLYTDFSRKRYIYRFTGVTKCPKS